MKLYRSMLTIPLLTLTLTLAACGGDSNSLQTDETSTSADGNDADNGGTSDSNGTGDGDTGDGNGTGDTGADNTGDDNSEDTGNDGDDSNGSGDNSSDSGRAIVSTIDSGFTSSVIGIIDTTAPFAIQDELNPGVSDTIVRAYEDNYYVIRRFESDSIAAYSVSDPSTPLYEVSTNSDDEADISSNPHDLVFLNPEKAYLIRYGSPLVWVVNPSASDPAQFKIGEIDLSAYDSDGFPEATRGVIVGDKLFIVMQRLESFTPTNTGYVAVIDTATDTEIDTGTGDSLPGIELPAFNPADVSVDASSDTILISAFGDFGAFDGSRPAAFTGGVVALDASDYSVTQLIDDNEGTGRINAVEVVSATTGFIVTSSEGLTSLDKFNPMTGNIEALGVAGLSGIDIRDIATGPAGNLWIAIADAVSPKIVILNPADNSLVAEGIATTLSPTGFAFTQ